MTMADERRELEVILSAWVWLATGHSLLYFLMASYISLVS